MKTPRAKPKTPKSLVIELVLPQPPQMGYVIKNSAIYEKEVIFIGQNNRNVFEKSIKSA